MWNGVSGVIFGGFCNDEFEVAMETESLVIERRYLFKKRGGEEESFLFKFDSFDVFVGLFFLGRKFIFAFFDYDIYLRLCCIFSKIV